MLAHPKKTLKCGLESNEACQICSTIGYAMLLASNSSDILLERCSDLAIRNGTPKGRGIFATKLIPAKTIVDICPALVLGLEENVNHIKQTSLFHYTYNWPVTDATGVRRIAQAVIFGLGSMFNHSAQHQNVVWERDTARMIVTYRALRDIQAGEELCISYGSHLTFEDADCPKPPSPEEELEQFNRIQLD